MLCRLPFFKTFAFFSTMAPRSTLSSSTMTTDIPTALEQSRKLQMPSREATLRRDYDVYSFWDDNASMLEEAWSEWQQQNIEKLPTLDSSLIEPRLRNLVEETWNDPSKEENIRDLWDEVVPGVYATQFFDLSQIQKIKTWLSAAAESGIPARPPHGIVLNKRGFMIDPRSVGYLAAPYFQAFYRDLVDSYVRPLGRLFFPSIKPHDDDELSFAFTIQYQAEQGGDRDMRAHTDASTVTFNINLDSEKNWTGSKLHFIDRRTGEIREFDWTPGVAVVHSGTSMHRAMPIESGMRNNLVIWTFGKDRDLVYGGMPVGQDSSTPEARLTSSKERWTKPSQPPPIPTDPRERWSPF